MCSCCTAPKLHSTHRCQVLSLIFRCCVSPLCAGRLFCLPCMVQAYSERNMYQGQMLHSGRIADCQAATLLLCGMVIMELVKFRSPPTAAVNILTSCSQILDSLLSQCRLVKEGADCNWPDAAWVGKLVSVAKRFKVDSLRTADFLDSGKATVTSCLTLG